MPISEPAKAATVIVLRAGVDGGEAEVLLLQRSRSVGFFPRAWVFPGGRLDESDAAVPTVGEAPGISADEVPFLVAAARECFEEAGIWLGEGNASPDLRENLLSERRGLTAADGLVADIGRFRVWSWWVTPEAEKRRYDTCFMVTCIDRALSETVTHDTRETVDAIWLTPSEARRRSAEGGLFLAPPTWRTLAELADFGSVDAIWNHARTRPTPKVMPVLSQSEHGVVIQLPGHPNHPSPVHPIHAHHARSIAWRDGRWWDSDDS